MITGFTAGVRSFGHGCRNSFASATIVFAAFLTGCSAAAVAVSAVQGPEKVPPQFELPDRATLVLVDDPNRLFENAGLARQVGSTAVYYLKTHKALTEAGFIEPREIARLEALLDREWSSTPIDEIGRRLGAQQVIHAKVTSVAFVTEDGAFRPHASLEAKVIDVETGRLWPARSPLDDPSELGPGVVVTTQLAADPGRTARDNGQPMSEVGRHLADEMGLNLAQLFYTWRKAEPGSGL